MDGHIYIAGNKRIIIYYEYQAENRHLVTDVKIDDLLECIPTVSFLR